VSVNPADFSAEHLDKTAARFKQTTYSVFNINPGTAPKTGSKQSLACAMHNQ